MKFRLKVFLLLVALPVVLLCSPELPVKATPRSLAEITDIFVRTFTSLSESMGLLDSAEPRPFSLLQDCMELVSLAEGICFHDLDLHVLPQAFQKFLLTAIKAVYDLRKGKQAVISELLEKSKTILIFMHDYFLTNYPVDNKPAVILAELFIRLPPTSHYYPLVMRRIWANITSEDDLRSMSELLLASINPQECFFFEVHFSLTAESDLPIEFFHAWYDGLSKCDFEGEQVRTESWRYLAASLLGFLSSSQTPRELSSLFVLFHGCLERIAFKKLFVTDIFLGRFGLNLCMFPENEVMYLLDQFFVEEHFVDLDEKRAMAFSRICVSFARFNGQILQQKIKELSKDAQKRICGLMSLCNEIIQCLRRYEALLSPDARAQPIHQWSCDKINDAIVFFQTIGPTLRYFNSIDAVQGAVIAKLLSFVVSNASFSNGPPSDDLILPIIRLVTVGFKVEMNIKHFTNALADHAEAFYHFLNVQLLPILRKDPMRMEEARHIYAARMRPFIEYLVANSFLRRSREPFLLFLNIVANLSDNPASDQARIVELAVSANLKYLTPVFQAFIYFEGETDFRPFLHAILGKVLRSEDDARPLAPSEKTSIKEHIEFLSQIPDEFSTSEIRLLKCLTRVI